MKWLALYSLSTVGLAVTTWKDVLVEYQPVFNTLAIGLVAAVTWYFRKKSKDETAEAKEKTDKVEHIVRNKVAPKPGGRRKYDPPAQEVHKD